MKKHFLWYEKYRPSTLSDYIMSDSQLGSKVEEWIAEKNIPHLLLTGFAGSGKTSLARILINSIVDDPLDVLEINASEKNNVQTIRDDIKSFAQMYPVGNFKIVFLDEADQLTPDAQGIMRRLMEDFSDTVKFILAGNYEHKILPAIKSRCQHYVFKKPTKEQMFIKMIDILDREDVEYDVEALTSVVNVGYPDIRKTIQSLQQYTIGGTLVIPESSSNTTDYKFELLDLLKEGNWIKMRELVCAQATGDEWEDLYKFMYENVSSVPSFDQDSDNWNAAIILIADFLYKHTLVADPEINFAALLIHLGNI